MSSQWAILPTLTDHSLHRDNPFLVRSEGIDYQNSRTVAEEIKRSTFEVSQNLASALRTPLQQYPLFGRFLNQKLITKSESFTGKTQWL